MNSSVTKFQTAFVAATSADRAQILFAVSKSNAKDTQITNLLSGINLNDVSIKNNKKADNIYFICSQLRAFPNFIY